MSGSINKAIIIGNLGRDPETRYTQAGQAITNLSVATTEEWKDQQGQRQQRTEWHRIVLFGRVAEVAGEYLKKGDSAYFEGKIQTRTWQDQSGQDRYSTEIVARELRLLEKKGKDQQQEQRRTEPQSQPAGENHGFDDFDDDIPF